MPTIEYTYRTVSNNSTISTTSDTILYSPTWANGTIYVETPQNSFPYDGPFLPQKAAPKEETPEAWLRRRVEEICWRPA